MRFSFVLVLLLSLVGLTAGCDGTESEPPTASGGANPEYAGRFVGEWGEEEPEANYILTVFMAPEQGRMVGTGSITQRLVVGAGFEESSLPLTLSGQVEEGTADPSVQINVQLPAGELIIVRGVGRIGANLIEGTLVGVTPYGAHNVEEFSLVRDE